MGRIVEIQLGEYRGAAHYDLNDVECGRGDYVIIEAEKGSEFGRLVSDLKAAFPSKAEHIKPEGRVLRKATEGDLKQIENNRAKVQDAVNTCVRKITDRRLQMNIIRAEYTFDSSKILFFFTAEGRVDFRNLVKDLAKIFRVRIELKQIGVRDRAKMTNGYGICGREFCCSSFIKSFHSLSIRMAKEQGLPLNPTRLSGVCGRIKCCMAYEFSAYKELARSLPRLGDKVNTAEGRGTVIDVNILKRTVRVDLGEGKIIKTVFEKAAAGAPRKGLAPVPDVQEDSAQDLDPLPADEAGLPASPSGGPADEN